MKEYPFIKCLHPKRIINPYTKEPVVVGCGHCEACLLQKSAMRSLRCKLESLSHRYCYFVTLTYDNDNVPVAKAVPYTTKVGGNIPYIKDMDVSRVAFVDETPRLNHSGEIVADTRTTVEDLALLDAKVGMNGYFPYLCREDAQKFIKRLRSNLAYLHKKTVERQLELDIKLMSVAKSQQAKENIYERIEKTYQEQPEKIRYYLAGEYGPVHYRPHYHLLLWFDEPITLWNIGQAIHKSWSFGRVDYSLSRGQASSYTSGYINGYCNLPQVYKSTETKPFAFHSIRLGEEILKSSKEDVYQTDPATFSRRSVSLDGTNTEFSVWRSFATLYYPRCTDYARKSSHERLYSYQIYATASRWQGETRPYCLSRKITDYVFQHGFDFYGITEFDDEIDKLLYYLYTRIKNPPLQELHDDNPDEYEYIFRVIYKEIRLSYHFLNNCCDNRYTPTRVLELIERYYSCMDADLLKRQLQLQSEFFKDDEFDFDDFDYMYNNSNADLRNINKTYYYRLMQSSVASRWENSVKHKRLNDMNNIYNNI